MDLAAKLTHEFLQKIRILVDFRVVPVDATVFAVYNAAHNTPVDLGFIQKLVKSQRRYGTKIRSLNTFDLAD